MNHMIRQENMKVLDEEKKEKKEKVVFDTSKDVQLSLNTFSSITILDFCNNNKIPYLLVHISYDGNKKNIKNIVSGWKKMSYQDLMNINKDRQNKKYYNSLSINLMASNYVVVDLDGDNYIEKLNKYGNKWVTESFSKSLPHIWFKKHIDDKNSNKIKAETDVDFIYHNIFEKIDNIMINCDEEMRVFNNFKKIDKNDKNDKNDNIKNDKSEKKNKIIINKKKDKMEITKEEIEIIDNIKTEYINNYQDWLKIIWALYNTFDDYKICDYISKKGKNYNGLDDVKKFIACDTKKLLSFGTIAHYSKLSNENKHFEIRSKYSDNFICGNDAGLAKLFIDSVGDDVIKDNGEIFVYTNPYWEQDKTNEILKKMVNKVLNKIVKININKINNNGDNTDDVQQKLKRLVHLRSSVNSLNKVRNVTQFVIMNLEEKTYNMDTHKPNYFCFENCAFDLETNQSIKINKYDYISEHTGYEYVIPTEENIKLIKKIINDIIPNEDKKDFLLCILKNCFNSTLIEKFVLFNGHGCNGKGLILEHMQKILGKYFTYTENELLTSKQREGGANPALRSLHKKRCVVYSEPEEGDRINLGNLKRYTGNPTVKGRGLYEDAMDINLMSMSIMECNTRPTFKGNCADNATRRRIIDFEFDQTFTDNIEEVEEYEDYHLKNYEYKTEEFKRNMRTAFFHVILENTRSIKNVPECVQKRSINYLMGSDELGVWFEENYQFVDDKKQYVKLKDVFDLFKDSEFYRNLSKEEKRGEWKKQNFLSKFECNIKYKKYYKNKININNNQTCIRSVLLNYQEKEKEPAQKGYFF